MEWMERWIETKKKFNDADYSLMLALSPSPHNDGY